MSTGRRICAVRLSSELGIKTAEAMGRRQQRRVEKLRMEKLLTADRIALVRTQIQWIQSRLAGQQDGIWLSSMNAFAERTS